MGQRCRAKNKQTCWKHGQGLGYDANREIKTALAENKVHKRSEIFLQSLKTYDSHEMATIIASYAEQQPNMNAALVKDAMKLAADVHRTDTRANRGPYERTAYIEHPLRNTLRVIRYGCNNQNIIIATLLHDTVEDHPYEIARDYAKQEPTDEADARRISFEYINKKFGPSVARIVEGMSNPITDKYMPAAEKNIVYKDHFVEAIRDPEVLVSKTSDFTDNALSLHHTEATMTAVSLHKKSTKYLLVIDHLSFALKKAYLQKKLPVAEHGFRNMMTQIEEGKTRLLRIQNQYK